MGTVADICRALLAVVFTVAAVAKLLDRGGVKNTMMAFGVSPRYAGPAGTSLPFAELAVAVALVIRPTARWGGVGALVLLILFIAGIVNVLRLGRTPECNCFGQIAKAPVSWRTLVRNGVLSALAVLVVAKGSGASLLAWTGSRTASEVIAVFLGLATIAVAMVAVQRQRDNRALEDAMGQLQREVALLPSGLPVGLRAPSFELPSVHGEKVTLESLRKIGRPVALVFISTDCGPCIRLLPELKRWHAALADRITFAVIGNGGEDAAADLRAAGDFVSLMQKQHELADFYRVHSTPSAVIINEEGRIASPLAGGPDEIEALVRVTLHRPQPSTGAIVGQAA